MRGVTHDDAPLLADLMPWSVAPPRLGRGWPAGPDAASLKARWDALVKAEGPDREALFEPSRSRTLHTAVGQLPGRTDSGTEKLVRASGPCPEPVRVLYAPFDEQWLIPDQRLIDAARPELWRVADERQVFLTETPEAVLATSLLPLLRPGRVRPLFRRPGGLEPNLAPGLLEHLGGRLGTAPAPLDVLAWITATARPDLTVPLTGDADAWERGLEHGHRLLWLMRRDGERPRLPGGRRPYVRAPLPSRPVELRYDRDEETLLLDEGRISPVPPEAWDYEVGGVRVLEQWFAARVTAPEPGTLAAIRPATWPQAWTSELLELITVLALLAETRPRAETPVPDPVTAAELRAAGVLPVPAAARRPASVLGGPEEGPEGQLALL
ncbi:MULTISPECIES: type ISP restriction/modification enzyme [Streptomyces]|uniref:Type ISP restriction/modification enzyme n=1 Tax=Streptomyces dubilierae TaxID=3075533 RepID=A0ABU2PCJ2_9ACTN|nr:type ISP restriction/modification enzyme [Streptomyces sp. DSM 41921]MDT0389871.1 type ISP restriction/modification enzyme [Streptomyces sp. DSM 41921]